MDKKILFDKKNFNSSMDEYYRCLSYCLINPKGIDEECKFICEKRYLNDNGGK